MTLGQRSRRAMEIGDPIQDQRLSRLLDGEAEVVKSQTGGTRRRVSTLPAHGLWFALSQQNNAPWRAEGNWQTSRRKVLASEKRPCRAHPALLRGPSDLCLSRVPSAPRRAVAPQSSSRDAASPNCSQLAPPHGFFLLAACQDQVGLLAWPCCIWPVLVPSGGGGTDSDIPAHSTQATDGVLDGYAASRSRPSLITTHLVKPMRPAANHARCDLHATQDLEAISSTRLPSTLVPRLFSCSPSKTSCPLLVLT
jgi:hypothetical protein